MITKGVKKKSVVAFCLGVMSFCFSQKKDSTYYYLNKNTSVASIELKIENEKKHLERQWLKMIYHAKSRNLDSTLHYINSLEENNTLSSKKKCRIHYLQGIVFDRMDNDSLSFYHYNKLFKKGLKIKDTLSVLISLEKLSQSYNYKEDNSYHLEYIKLLDKYSKLYNVETFKIKHQFLLGNYYLFREQNIKASSSYKKALRYKFNKKDSLLIPSIYSNIGTLYLENLSNVDSALFYYKKAILFSKSFPKFKKPQTDFLNYLNLGNCYMQLKKHKKANYFYSIADTIKMNSQPLFYKSVIKENLADLNFKLKNFEKAYTYLDEYIMLSDSLNKEDHEISIADIQTKYETVEKEKQILELNNSNLLIEAKRIKNRNFLIAATVSLFFSVLIFYLVQKSTKRKQLLAEQESELQKQRLATVLKEQELTSIDAMIVGQEKERQRIANDLHDDLGGLMANVKLHFNVLKEKRTPELYNKTNALLDEAYQKIRGIAHAKNSGVIANQGLLKAIKEMANKISALNKINIEVVDFGLDNRLDNTLEITLFRIIQELVTNIIKHANASQASISLTNHEHSLNIIIEDNGKGFDVKHIGKAKGMGITSIEKRIDHLEGALTIDSEIKKGTTIIIDIPL